MVIAELVLVLSNRHSYGFTASQVRDCPLPIIGLPHLEVEHKRLCRRVLKLQIEHGSDYVDACNAARMEGRYCDVAMGYDRHFDLLSAIQRVEP